MKKNLLWRLFAVFFVFSFLFPMSVWGITQEDCEMRAEKGELDLLNEDDLKACVNFFNQSRLSKTSQRLTLEEELNKLNKAILITSTNILVTTREISNLEKEIINLTSKIGQLDLSLDEISEILAKRIAETYKKGKVDFVSLFLSSQNFSDFVSRFKYLRIVQLHDRQLMIQMETARTNFEDQKTLKEQKQEELDAAKKKLESQKILLTQQKAAKDDLLAATKNDERKYQQLQSQAQAQLAAFRKFVTSQGGATILSNQTKCDDWGCYYNQRDSQWGNIPIGLSDITMADAGCLVSSVAMIAKHYGKNITPADIASSPAAFEWTTAYMKKSWSDKGMSVSRSGFSPSEDRVNNEISAGRPVIVGLYGTYNYPEHFIVIKGKDSRGYIMNDPFMENGNDRPLTDKYSFSDVVRVDLVSIN